MSHHKHKLKSLREMEELYVSLEQPITPVNGFKSFRSGRGWKFYESIRGHLPEWWEEFNGDLDRYGRLKHTTIRLFIKSKAKRADEQRYLLQMLGAATAREEKCEVPWLGDWDKRRRNGFGLLDNVSKIKPLIKCIKENLAAVDTIRSLTPFLAEDLVTYSSLERQVHEAFAGRAFLTGKEANDKNNVARFNSYKMMLAACLELKVQAIHEIMRVQGVDPDTPQQMRDVAQIAGGIGAAAALTGIAAGQSIPGLGVGVSTPQGTALAPYTFDALKLAEHLTRHAHVFKKPLPTTIEADPSSFDEDDASNRKHKGNGKVI